VTFPAPTVSSRRMNWRFWSLALACLALTLTFFAPNLPLPQRVYRYVFVIDITQSMNTQDYHLEGLPPDRLGFAKEAIRRVIPELPCGSEVGLGIFTTRNTQLLFEPLEVCGHLSVIDDVLARLDWRMAWAADSLIGPGLFSAIRAVKERDAGLRLAFFSDGQDAPPQPRQPAFAGLSGEVAGLIVGVGGTQPALVPRYDRDNHLLGYWENIDIATPPDSGADAALPREGFYQSRLDEARLLELSAATGLRYHRLENPASLGKALRGSEFAEHRTVATDIRWLLALAALILVFGVYLG
jgi:mxaL protein